MRAQGFRNASRPTGVPTAKVTCARHRRGSASGLRVKGGQLEGWGFIPEDRSEKIQHWKRSKRWLVATEMDASLALFRFHGRGYGDLAACCLVDVGEGLASS